MGKKSKNIWGWIFGGIFVLAALGTFSESFLAGIVFLLTGAFLFPPARSKISEKYNIDFPKHAGLLIGIVGLIIGLWLLPGNTSGHSDSSPTNVGDTGTQTATGCSSDWLCTNWSECSQVGTQSRNCTDTAACETAKDKPVESRLCKGPAQRLVASYLSGELDITLDDLEAKANPKGEGVFVYVPETRFHGVERYFIWVVIDGEAYKLNGATDLLTPDLEFPRNADPALWEQTGLEKYSAIEAIEIVFK